MQRNLYAWILGLTALVWLGAGIVAIHQMDIIPTNYEEASPQPPPS
jgi:hypothetical protein